MSKNKNKRRRYSEKRKKELEKLKNSKVNKNEMGTGFSTARELHDENQKGKEKKPSLLSRIKKANDDYDYMVKGVEKTEKKEKKLPSFLLKLGIVIVGIGILVVGGKLIKGLKGDIDATNSKVICSASKVYQYAEAKKEDFTFVTPKGKYTLDKLPEDSVSYFVSPVYTEKYFGVMVDNHVYSVECNFIKAASIEWLYKDNSVISLKELENLKPEDLSGKITYEDGTVSEMKADSVSVTPSEDKLNTTVVIKQGNNSYSWKPSIVED